MLHLVLASANPEKAGEMASILEDVPGLVILPRPPGVPDVDETGETLLDNARLKARALVAATGEAAIADDTGLEVVALDGEPGVYSARYSGEHATYADNVARLLVELDIAGAHDVGQRRARFVSVVLVAFPDSDELWAEGKIDGSIAPSAVGSGGFGYDPVFIPDGFDGRTFAQMTAAEKHRISHRGRALRAVAEQLRSGRRSASPQ
jgi:XTP/dITP diphosphohydrolase